MNSGDEMVCVQEEEEDQFFGVDHVDRVVSDSSMKEETDFGLR